MKYRELISFEPITSVIKLVDTTEKDIAEHIVKTYVFSKRISEDLNEIIIKNLNPTPSQETKGIQIVGSYGTGKSHLMALVAAIAENEDLVSHLIDEKMKEQFKSIAGKYKVLRFEIGTDRPLKDIVFAQIERYLKKENVQFTFDENSNYSWKEQIQDMMSEFENSFPDKHFMIVIDELLEYLKGRNATVLNNDLMLLRQLGEACDNSRFKIMFGVQELLYRSPEFQFAAEMLNKVEDRFSDIIITKEDVAYVVKERLLKKGAPQKQMIRDHLIKFAPMFDGINTDINEYVDLFPVHPSYINHFERVKHGKSQREILKVLSNKFLAIIDEVVPEDKPGLITYDSYWEELVNTSSMLTIPDIRTVKDKVEIIYEKINSHFIQARASKKQSAIQITNALAIRILCDDLDKKNGANANILKEDLCITLPGIDDPELLVQNIESILSQLKSATSGQYIDQESMSDNFHIRTEGGVNFEQLIREYADTILKKNEDQADQYYFDLLQYILGIEQNTYRTGFKIWQHSLEWIDKKSFRLGYIFFGNPNERSTTEPIQQYYIFFCPLFNSISRNDESDEIYFDMSGFSSDFKEAVLLYGAAKALEANASSDKKAHFRTQIEQNRDKVILLFDKEYIDKTTVIYKSTASSLKNYQLPGEGASKEMIFSSISSKVLNKHFSDKYPDYPAFNDLLSPIAKLNFEGRIKSALKKIHSSVTPNRDGEAILSGLGLLSSSSIDTQNSKYADSIKKKLKAKGEGKVVNRDEIIYSHYAPHNLWYSVDYNIDHELEFVVLAAMVFKGDIEVVWSGSKTLTATNIDQQLLTLANEDFFTYQNIKEPTEIPIKSIKALFSCLGLPDLSSDLDNPLTLTKIITESKTRAERAVKLKALLGQGINCKGISLITASKAAEWSAGLENLITMLDSIQNYNTTGKLKGFKYTENELNDTFKAWNYCDQIEKIQERARKFEELIGYLNTAKDFVVEEEKPLYDDIEDAINKLSVVLQEDKDAEFKKYETLLNSLKSSYADYYLKQYSKCRLSHHDYLIKDKILNSHEKHICDIIKDIDFIAKTEYENWINTITSLKEADQNVTKTAILEIPNHSFNPREYYGKLNYSIKQLEEQLSSILEKWVKALRSIFKDPSIKANLDVLDKPSRELIEGFKDEKIEITVDNAATLKKLIGELSKGFERIEISSDDIKKIFSKPYTVQDAVEVFTEYVEKLCEGKERGKVRIIVK